MWDYSTAQAIDLDSFEGERLTSLKARFAQQHREQARKPTRAAMRRKAAQGYVTGNRVFGYDNEGPQGQKRHRINETEAAVVRDLYARLAAGQGARSIAGAERGPCALTTRAAGTTRRLVSVHDPRGARTAAVPRHRRLRPQRQGVRP